MKIRCLAAILALVVSLPCGVVAQDIQGVGSGTTGNAPTTAPSTNPGENLRGEVATVDEANGKIGVKLSGTVGSGDSTTPTIFKVQDGLIFNAVKPGDKVSFTAERLGDDMTIKTLTKE